MAVLASSVVVGVTVILILFSPILDECYKGRVQATGRKGMPIRGLRFADPPGQAPAGGDGDHELCGFLVRNFRISKKG
jgi:hypothetical protein